MIEIVNGEGSFYFERSKLGLRVEIKVGACKLALQLMESDATFIEQYLTSKKPILSDIKDSSIKPSAWIDCNTSSKPSTDKVKALINYLDRAHELGMLKRPIV